MLDESAGLTCTWLPAGAAPQQVPWAAPVQGAALMGVYVLAGIPELVELMQGLASLHIDTHVLMALAVLGTLAMGSYSEVRALSLRPVTRLSSFSQAVALRKGSLCKRLHHVPSCHVHLPS